MLAALALSALAHLGFLADSLAIAARPPIVPPVPISVAVATVGGAPVKDAAWIEERMAEPARLYNPLGIYFRKPELRPLGEQHAALETREDRDALGALWKKGVVNVFVVSTLRDVDNKESLIMGVHWAPGGDLAHHFIIVAARASKTTLAHELGHYFGLPHKHVPDNLMSYNRTGIDVFLDSSQKVKVRTNAVVLSARERLRQGGPSR
jgi:hypothetical protein